MFFQTLLATIPATGSGVLYRNEGARVNACARDADGNIVAQDDAAVCMQVPRTVSPAHAWHGYLPTAQKTKTMPYGIYVVDSRGAIITLRSAVVACRFTRHLRDAMRRS